MENPLQSYGLVWSITCQMESTWHPIQVNGSYLNPATQTSTRVMYSEGMKSW